MKVPVRLSLLFFFCLAFLPARAQNRQDGRHTVYAELLGNAYAWSVNYDYLVYRDSRIKLSAGAGFGYLPFRSLKGPAVPLQLTLMYHRETAHHLEIGAGITYFHLSTLQRTPDMQSTVSNTRDYVILSPRIGYSFRKPGGGLFLRAAVLPSFRVSPLGTDISSSEKDAFMFARTFSLWCGIGAGYTF